MSKPLKLLPVTKERIWGKDELYKRYGIGDPEKDIGEAWMLTVREDEQNIIDGVDMTINEYLGYPRDFPLLVKFLASSLPLSVQVHPTKDEAWYIVSAKENSKIVYGLAGNPDIKDLIDSFSSDNPLKYLNFVNVKPGEIYYIPHGLVHALGEDITVAEIQRNDDTTYRLYDYKRKDKNGKERDLHLESAKDVIYDYTQNEIEKARFMFSEGDGIIADNDAFRSYVLDINKEQKIENNGYMHILCISGSGKINDTEINQGDSFFISKDIKEAIITNNKNDMMKIIVSCKNQYEV